MATNIHLHAFLNWLFLSSVYMYYVYIWTHIHLCMCECGHSHSCCVCAMAFIWRSESKLQVSLSFSLLNRSLACSLICQISLRRCTWTNFPASTAHLPVYSGVTDACPALYRFWELKFMSLGLHDKLFSHWVIFSACFLKGAFTIIITLSLFKKN